MPSLTVRNIDEDLKQRLKEQAAKHGCSMEEEVRRILRVALLPSRSQAGHKTPGTPQEGLGTEIHNLFKDLGLTEADFPPFPREKMRLD